jgi:hypothetical protein
MDTSEPYQPCAASAPMIFERRRCLLKGERPAAISGIPGLWICSWTRRRERRFGNRE